VIATAVRWYRRYGLPYRHVEELLAERGIDVDHVTIYRWVQTFTPEFIDAARPTRHAAGDRWFVDETYVKVAGRWTYLYRAIDQHGQVIDVPVSTRHDAAAAQAFFVRAKRFGPVPVEVVTDRAPVYPRLLDELAPGRAACHRAIREQRDRIRPRPAQGPATTNARSQTPGLRAHHHRWAGVHAEPASRPLRNHRRSTGARSGPRRVQRARYDPLTSSELPASPVPARSACTNATAPSRLYHSVYACDTC
jgi:transposase-like protein